MCFKALTLCLSVALFAEVFPAGLASLKRASESQRVELHVLFLSVFAVLGR